MKLTKAQLRQTIEEELASEGFFDSFTKKGRAKKAAEEDAQAAAKRLEKTLAKAGETLSDETKALALKLLAANPRRLRAYDAIKQAQKQRGEPTWAEEAEAKHQKELADLRGGRKRSKSFRSSGLYGSEDPHSRPQGRVRPSTGAGQLRGSGTSAYGESKDHTMKLNYEKLARLVKEELEVILTDEEANEMFGLKNMVQEISQLRGGRSPEQKREDPDYDPDDPEQHLDDPDFKPLGLGGARRPPTAVAGGRGGSRSGKYKYDSTSSREHEFFDAIKKSAADEQDELDKENPVRRALAEEAQLQEADVAYIAKMLLDGLLALHKAGVTPTAIIDALRGAGERERGAMVGLPGFEELPPEVQGAVGGNVAQHDQARGLAMEEGGSQYTIPPGGFGGRSHGKGSCEGECNNSQNYHQCLEDCKERKRAEQGRSSAKLDKRIGLGQWEEGKVTMSRKGLTDMIREEMARLVIIKP